MRVRIPLLPRDFSALWRALCARRRGRHRDIRLGRTNVAQERAQRSSTKILHDSSLPIAAPVGSCQVRCFELVRKKHARKSILAFSHQSRRSRGRSLPHPGVRVLHSIACASGALHASMISWPSQTYSASASALVCAKPAGAAGRTFACPFVFVRSFFAFALHVRSVERARSLPRRTDARSAALEESSAGSCRIQ